MISYHLIFFFYILAYVACISVRFQACFNRTFLNDSNSVRRIFQLSMVHDCRTAVLELYLCVPPSQRSCLDIIFSTLGFETFYCSINPYYIQYLKLHILIKWEAKRSVPLACHTTLGLCYVSSKDHTFQFENSCNIYISRTSTKLAHWFWNVQIWLYILNCVRNLMKRLSLIWRLPAHREIGRQAAGTSRKRKRRT